MPTERKQPKESKTNIVIRTRSGKEYYLYLDTEEAEDLINSFVDKCEILFFKDNEFDVILRWTQIESIRYFKEEV